jgi:hypothetical protein
MTMLLRTMILASLWLTSCKTLMVKRMFKDPKVENTATIKEFQTKNHFSTSNSLIQKADTSNVQATLITALNNATNGYYVFDKQGNLVCYTGTTTCSGTQFRQLLDGNIDSFQTCKEQNTTLHNILEATYDLEENPVTLAQLKTADYYVVSYWAKFVGGRKGYKEQVAWMEDLIMQNKSRYKFTYIKINADMQESWGFVPGGKAKINIKRDGISITDLPMKR